MNHSSLDSEGGDLKGKELSLSDVESEYNPINSSIYYIILDIYTWLLEKVKMDPIKKVKFEDFGGIEVTTRSLWLTIYKSEIRISFRKFKI